jgi:hypothetical protein
MFHSQVLRVELHSLRYGLALKDHMIDSFDRELGCHVLMPREMFRFESILLKLCHCRDTTDRH